MDDGRRVFQRLYQIRMDGILEQCRHGTLGFQICRGDRLPCIIVADDDAADTLFQVLQVTGKAEDGHDLRGNGDHVTIFTRYALQLAA